MAEKTISPTIKSMLFDIRRSARYHLRRENYFDTVSTVSAVLILASGSSMITSVLASGDRWYLDVITGISAAVAGILSAVVMPARKARIHNSLARRFIELEMEAIDPDADLLDITKKRLSIEAEEPPVKRVLDLICHNEMVKAGGADAGNYVPIPRFNRFLMTLGISYGAEPLERQKDRSRATA